MTNSTKKTTNVDYRNYFESAMIKLPVQEGHVWIDFRDIVLIGEPPKDTEKNSCYLIVKSEEVPGIPVSLPVEEVFNIIDKRITQMKEEHERKMEEAQKEQEEKQRATLKALREQYDSADSNVEESN